jgi:hypothetical protein
MTNVRELVKTEVALQKKAMIWTNKQLVLEKQVTIQQLASALRVSVAKAEEVMHFQIYGVGDVALLGVKLQIFVIDGKLPDWLRKFLNKIQIASVLRTAKSTTSTLIERDVHRKVLSQVYGDSFKDILTASYRRASDTLFNALVQTNLVTEAAPCELHQFDQLTNPRWAFDRMTGRAGLAHHVRKDDGLTVHIHFGNQPPETLEAMDLTVSRPISVNTEATTCSLTAEEIADNKAKLEHIIESMRQAGYALLSVHKLISYLPKKGEAHTRLLFAENTDIGLTIALTAPWQGLVFK